MTRGWLGAEETSDLLSLLGQNPVVGEVLQRAEQLALPGWVLTGGCIFQTVWNVLDQRPARSGIRDYDLFYFDDTNLSWEAEDAALAAAAEAFDGCGGIVETRNEARVHLWFEDRFGVDVTPLQTAEGAIDRFVATACGVGVTTRDGEVRVYAPFGLEDLYEFRLRPNPVLDVAVVYRAKAERWQELWPRLTVAPWPETGNPGH